MTLPVLELKEFGVAYGQRTVLSSVTLDIPAQGCTMLLGPSGTGKSTLLRTLAGYNGAMPQLRSWGHARYAGESCTQARRPALVMQNSRLLLANVLENLVCSLANRSTLTRGQQVDAVRPLLEACGQLQLLDMLANQVVELPLGLQRVIAILREAAARPALLMVDEPTAGLTTTEAAQVLLVLSRLAQHLALLVVTHNLQEARLIGQQVVLLAAGVVQESQPVEGFFTAPLSDSGRSFLATGSCPEPAAAATESPDADDGAAAVVASVPARPARSVPAAVPSAACGPRGFVWLLPGQLAGTPWPGVIHGADYDLMALRSVGVTHLVSLTEEPFNPLVAARHGIGCLASPMPDMHPPTVQQALGLCNRIDQLLAADSVVAVHCHAGLGRTGTVLAAYWLWRARGELSAVRALEDVRRLEPGWVQSEAQVRFLEEFALVVANAREQFRDFHDPAATLDIGRPHHENTSATYKESFQ